MRLLTICSVLATMCVLVATAALAGIPGADATGGGVSGDGSTAMGFSVSVGAHGTPTSGSGTLVQKIGSTAYVAKVDCVAVFGNSALVVGTLDKPIGAYTKLVAEFVDNGNGHSGAPDAAVSGLSTGGDGSCQPATVDFSDAFPIVHGNFVVRSD